MPALFSVLTGAFVAIAYAGALHGRWPIAVGAAAIGAFMANLAWISLRRMRR
jgi:hypothetical protein